MVLPLDPTSHTKARLPSTSTPTSTYIPSPHDDSHTLHWNHCALLNISLKHLRESDHNTYTSVWSDPNTTCILQGLPSSYTTQTRPGWAQCHNPIDWTMLMQSSASTYCSSIDCIVWIYLPLSSAFLEHHHMHFFVLMPAKSITSMQSNHTAIGANHLMSPEHSLSSYMITTLCSATVPLDPRHCSQLR